MGDHADDALATSILYELDDGTRDRDYYGDYGYYGAAYIKPKGEGPCPLCDAPTVKRTGPYGKFWGCSKFPNCKGSRGWKFNG